MATTLGTGWRSTQCMSACTAVDVTGIPSFDRSPSPGSSPAAGRDDRVASWPFYRSPAKLAEAPARVSARRCLLDLDVLEPDVVQGAVAGIPCDAGDRVDHLHAGDHPAEDRVLAGQPGGRGLGDEELGPVG